MPPTPWFPARPHGGRKCSGLNSFRIGSLWGWMTLLSGGLLPFYPVAAISKLGLGVCLSHTRNTRTAHLTGPSQPCPRCMASPSPLSTALPELSGAWGHLTSWPKPIPFPENWALELPLWVV